VIQLDPVYGFLYDPAQMQDPDYFAKLNERYKAGTGVRLHSHTCSLCGRVITHTRLEALRDGEKLSHTCCGKDVRFKQAAN
jgi:hypothetical protein